MAIIDRRGGTQSGLNQQAMYDGHSVSQIVNFYQMMNLYNPEIIYFPINQMPPHFQPAQTPVPHQVILVDDDSEKPDELVVQEAPTTIRVQTVPPQPVQPENPPRPKYRKKVVAPTAPRQPPKARERSRNCHQNMRHLGFLKRDFKHLPLLLQKYCGLLTSHKTRIGIAPRALGPDQNLSQNNKEDPQIVTLNILHTCSLSLLLSLLSCSYQLLQTVIIMLRQRQNSSSSDIQRQILSRIDSASQKYKDPSCTRPFKEDEPRLDGRRVFGQIRIDGQKEVRPDHPAKIRREEGLANRSFQSESQSKFQLGERRSKQLLQQPKYPVTKPREKENRPAREVKFQTKQEGSKYDYKYTKRQQPKPKYQPKDYLQPKRSVYRTDPKQESRYTSKYGTQLENKYESRHAGRYDIHNDSKQDSKYQSRHATKLQNKYESKVDRKFSNMNDSKYQSNYSKHQDLYDRVRVSVPTQEKGVSRVTQGKDQKFSNYEYKYITPKPTPVKAQQQSNGRRNKFEETEDPTQKKLQKIHNLNVQIESRIKSILEELRQA